MRRAPQGSPDEEGHNEEGTAISAPTRRAPDEEDTAMMP
jgi:hypothetical protein